MRFLLPLLIIIITLASTTTTRAQNPQPADQIVALVNDKVILKSDIDNDVASYLQQARSYGDNIPFTIDLWYDFLDAKIETNLLLEKARIDSIIIPDEQVNRQMDQRVNQLIQQAGSEQALEQAFGKPIIQLKEEFRENFREQMLTEQVRQNKFYEIEITRPEVQEFFDSIPVDSLPTIPEQVSISQIVIIPPAKQDARESAYQFAQSIRDSALNHGLTIEELARKHSMGPSAPRGGLLPLMDLSALVSEYSAAASALQPGQISEVVETQFGFHVIELIRRIGDQIETRHVLISIDQEELDDEYAIGRLSEIKDSVQTYPDHTFSSMARKHSEDPFTKVSGGKILDPQTGERLIPLSRLDPALYRIVLLMDEVGAISEPRPFNTNTGNKAYRIMRLDQQIPEHVANMNQDYERLRSIALQQKQFAEYAAWIEDLKRDVYIEYRIPTREEMLNQ
ncbi:MAG: peptidylprolyl isomerase [Balneolales bacterium]|nr:peptidylprolyl isomerase [Balneolales bacterium]